MDAFLHSISLVALSEIGDKTQLLAIILAARYRQPCAIIAGIFLATLVNHALAAWIGQMISGLVNGIWLNWGIAVSFILIGLWILRPDSMDETEDKHNSGAFITTFLTFFVAEIGDKTQLATIVLAAEYRDLLPVVIGTTVGMLIANVPVVIFGHKLLAKIPMNKVRYCASLLFIGFGAWNIFTLLMGYNGV